MVMAYDGDVVGLEMEIQDGLFCPDCLPSCSDTIYTVSSEKLPLIPTKRPYKSILWVVFEEIRILIFIKKYSNKYPGLAWTMYQTLLWFECFWANRTHGYTNSGCRLNGKRLSVSTRTIKSNPNTNMRTKCVHNNTINYRQPGRNLWRNFRVFAHLVCGSLLFRHQTYNSAASQIASRSIQHNWKIAKAAYFAVNKTPIYNSFITCKKGNYYWIGKQKDTQTLWWFRQSVVVRTGEYICRPHRLKL